MNERKVLRHEIVTNDGTHGCSMPVREHARGVLEFLRSHVVGRRVDEIAREKDSLDDAGKVVAVDPGGQFELDLFFLLLAVARETVAAECEGERGEPRVMRRIGKAVRAWR